MRERNGISLAALVAVCLALACAGSAVCQSVATLEWSGIVNDIPATYITRGLDVNQSNGNIYAAIDSAANRQIIELDWEGDPDGTDLRLFPDGYGDAKVLNSYGPEFYDASGTLKLNLLASSNYQLWGVAVDPKTNFIYVAADVDVGGGVRQGQVHVVDVTSTPPVGQNCTWVGVIATDGTTVRGCRFSDDGMKFVVAWRSSTAKGSCGAKLFTRNLQGTPTDFTDDTWDFAANLVSTSSFGGLGSAGLFATEPRAAAFDRSGDIYVAGTHGLILKYSGTAPYPLIGEIVSTNRVNVSRYCVDTDGQNNLYVTAEPDGDGVRRVWGINQNAVPILKFDPSSIGSWISYEYCAAFDRVRNRLIVAGRYDTNYSVVDSYSLDVYEPGTVTLKGRITDDATGQPIANAAFGYVEYSMNTTWQTVPRAGGMWHKGMTDANGNFSIGVPEDTQTVMTQADAPGYLRKRIHNVVINWPETEVNIRLKSGNATSLTWTAPDPVGTSGQIKSGEEDGLLHHIAMEGGRAFSTVDPLFSQSCMRIGFRTDTSSYGCRDNFLYFAVDDEWLYNGSPTSTVWVTVEYLDYSTAAEGWDALALEADFGITLPNVSIGEIIKSAPQSAAWKKRTFKATQVKFGNNSTDGAGGATLADFRVHARKDLWSGSYLGNTGPDWIKSVAVSKTEPVEPNTYPTINEAKAIVSGPVVLKDKVITAQWDWNTMYLAEPNRTGGIKVVASAGWWALDQRIGRNCSVYGVLLPDPQTGEPCIWADTWSDDPFTLPAPVRTLAVRGREAFTIAEGPNMTGLKVRVWGTVTDMNKQSGWLKVDDGSGDVKVVVTPNMVIDWPGLGDYVTVEGIASLEGETPAESIRVIRPWSSIAIPGNGGFEDDFSGWFWVVHNGAQATAWIDTTNPYAGSKCVSFSNQTPLAPHVYGTLARWDGGLVPNAQYELSVWVRGVNVAEHSHLTDWNYYLLPIPAGTYDWQRISTTFSTPGSGVETRVNIANLCDQLSLDSIGIQPTAGMIRVLRKAQ